MPVEFEELELPFDDVLADVGDVGKVGDVTERGDGIELSADGAPVCRINRDPMGTFPCCPMCGGEMRPEHAHYRCACGWRDSCCD